MTDVDLQPRLRQFSDVPIIVSETAPADRVIWVTDPVLVPGAPVVFMNAATLHRLKIAEWEADHASPTERWMIWMLWGISALAAAAGVTDILYDWIPV